MDFDSVEATGFYMPGKLSMSKDEARSIVHGMTEEKRKALIQAFMGDEWEKARTDLSPEFIADSLTFMLMVGMAHMVNGEYVFGGQK